ncbi:MAG TPA: YkvA family protein [bacterium]|nr:YkvA family protein [bacterium]
MDLRARARRLKQELVALHLAYRDPRTPWYAKALPALVIAYALSPIDLIPDFIPVLGYLDDVILLPLGIALALRLIPREVMDDCRRRANEQHRLPVSKTGAVLVVVCWLAALAALAWWIVRRISA